MGGTLALYSRKGCDVYLICATRGEAGTVDEEHSQGFGSVAEMRESELRCAAGILGLKDVFLLGFRDSGMAGSQDNQHPNALINQPVDDVAKQITGYIRTIRPDIILTFDPIGGYQHPDHIHIHEATGKAFHRASDPSYFPETGKPYQVGALYFHTIPHTFLKMATILLRILGKDPRKWGRNGDIDLQSIVDVQFPTHVKVSVRSVWKEKGEASACHNSQGGGRFRGGIIGWFGKLVGEYETYMRAYPPFQGNEKMASDLFDFPKQD